MAKAKQAEQPVSIIPMLQSDFMSILVLGAVTGLVIWGLGLVLNRYVFDVYLCQSELSSQCASAKNYSAVVATIIGGIAALVGLIRLRVYRPLLVLIASVLSLWGVVQIGWNLELFTGLVIAVLLYGLAFGLYSWIARIREFWISLLVIILLVVAVRLALVA